MSAAAFTPGPWHAQDLKQKHPRFGIVTAKNVIVARSWIEPDARLIAAAPELYEAADAMVRWDAAEKAARPFDEDAGRAFYDRMDLCAEAFTKARAALAKARGEQ